MGKDSAAPPDYKAAADATANSGIQQLQYQTKANRPDITTPWGKSSWTQDPGTLDNSKYQEALADWRVRANGAPDDGTMPRQEDYQTEGDWHQNISLDPKAQQALDAQQDIQMGRSRAAGTLLDQATAGFRTPANWDNLPGRAGNIDPSRMDTSMGRSAFGFGDVGPGQSMQKSLNGDAAAYRQRAQDAVDELQRPQLERTRAAAQTRLSNQGFADDSEAAKSDMRDVSDNESRAHLMAIAAGRDEAQQMFGQDLSEANLGNSARSTEFNEDLQRGQFQNQRQGQDSQEIAGRFAADNSARAQDTNNQVNAFGFNNTNRQQAITEMAQKRGMSLNELNALLTGQQVNMPQMPGAPNASAGRGDGANYTGAATSQYGAANDQANANNASASATYGAIGSAALTALSFY